MNRREFVGMAAAGAAALAGLGTAEGQAAAEKKIVLPALPYPDIALDPVISARTLEFHYGKHHAGYLTNLNNQIPGTEFAGMSLEGIVRKTAGVAEHSGIFNNAAQVWNHTFYWKSMKPGGGGTPAGKVADLIRLSFTSFDVFRQQFVNAALTQFASGWAWLVLKEGKLVIEKTPNAETPFTGAGKPLLTIDVWEHAYYLDYQNRRKDYAEAWVDKLLNWDFVAKNLG